jgi:uncharacterized membrane protein YbhN (UPF0104 family)
MFSFAVAGFVLLKFAHQTIMNKIIMLYNFMVALIHKLPWFKKHTHTPLNPADFDQKTILRAFLLSIIKFCFTVTRMVLFASALNLSISPALILLGTPVGQLSYLFAFTPGGLGIFDAGWYAILRVGGVSLKSATQFVVGQRFLTMGLIWLIALSSQVLYTLRKASKEKTTPYRK